MKSTMKRIAALALGASLLLGSAQAAQLEDFTDVSRDHWAYSYISKAAYADLISGIGDGKFGPELPVSSGQFLVMVTNLFYHNQVEEFAKRNTTDDWWRPYLGAADKYSLLTQTELDIRTPSWDRNDYWQDDWTEAHFNHKLDRYTMAMILWNLNGMQHWGTTTQAELKMAREKIADWNTIPEKYQEAVACVYARGFLSGVDKAGNFAGDQTMTRAQSAVILCKLADIKKEWDSRGNYPTNSKGHTYGVDDDYLRYGVYPDLIGVQGINGNPGYCFYKELRIWNIEPDGIGLPEETAYHFAQPEYVNVYDLDENVIDKFMANGGKIANLEHWLWDYVPQTELEKYFEIYKAYFEEQGYEVTDTIPQRTDWLPSEYSKTEHGHTYGRDEDFLHYGTYPELIHMVGEKGWHGYVFKRELDFVPGPDGYEPEELAGFTAAQPEWLKMYNWNDQVINDKVKPQKADMAWDTLDQAKLTKYFNQYKAYFESQGYKVTGTIPSTKS